MVVNIGFDCRMLVDHVLGLYLRNRSFLRLKYRKHLCLEPDVTRGQANIEISGRLAESGIVQLQSAGEIMVL